MGCGELLPGSVLTAPVLAYRVLVVSDQGRTVSDPVLVLYPLSLPKGKGCRPGQCRTGPGQDQDSVQRTAQVRHTSLLHVTPYSGSGVPGSSANHSRT